MSDLTLDQLYEKYGAETLPSYEWMRLMGWPTDVIASHPSRANVDSSRPFDTAGVGTTIRNLARSYGSTTDPMRSDRERWSNGCYIELGYGHASITLRWGRTSRPGDAGGIEDSMEIVSAVPVEQREFIKETLKELAYRD